MTQYIFKYELLENGKPNDTDYFDVELAPLKSKEIKVNTPSLLQKKGIEYALNVFAYTRKGTEILPATFEVAREQFIIYENNYFTQKNKMLMNLNL